MLNHIRTRFQRWSRIDLPGGRSLFVCFVWVAAIVNWTVFFSWKFDLKVSGCHIHRIDDSGGDSWIKIMLTQSGALVRNMAMCRPCSLERYGWLMIGMGDRGILIFVSEPLLTFFPETKSGFYVWDIIQKFGEYGVLKCRWCICDDGFSSLKFNIRIVNDRMFFFGIMWYLYGSNLEDTKKWFKMYFWDNLCGWNWKLWPSDQFFTHPLWMPMVRLWTWWFLFGGVTWGGSFSSFRTVEAEIIPARWVKWVKMD